MLTGLASPSRVTGISALFPNDQYFAYYDPTSVTSILQAVEDLSAYVATEGPFDGVMGFSQGAALAAMLLARDSSPVPFSFAIFLCAGLPLCEASLRKGVIRHLDPRVDGEVIRVPTAHIVGAKDDSLEACLALKDLCYERVRALFDHGAGHEVPVSPKGITGDMAKCAEDVIAKATFVQ